MTLSSLAAFRYVSGLVLVLLAALGGCQKKPKLNEATAQGGRVARLVAPGSGMGLEVCDPAGSACTHARVGSAVPSGSTLRSGARTSAEVALADGSTLTLDHDTEFKLGSRSRSARLSHGRVVLAVARRAGARARFEANQGTVELGAGKVAARAGADFVILDVLRGSARLRSGDANSLEIRPGEEARLYRDGEPLVTSGAALDEAARFTDRFTEENESSSQNRGLGELVARKPGSSDELRSVVTLASHRVRVRIAGMMARTEIDEVFENSSDQVLEGVYRFPIPTNAKIERLALEVDGALQEGAFVDRDRAAAIWRGVMVHAAPSLRPQIKDDIVWVPGPWRDPALLEWQRGSSFELKIFPIPQHGQRRIVLAYTEAVRPVGGVRHYTYPLPVDPGGTTQVRHFDMDVEVRGDDPRVPVRTSGYALEASERDGLRSFHFGADGFTPNGDLGIEWALPDRNSELTAFAYRSDGGRYAVISLRPKLPRGDGDRLHATAIVVDSSRSMFGEGLERAKRLATRMARELDPTGRVTVLACDSVCREFRSGFVEPGPSAAHEIERFLADIPAEGASDPTQAIASAERALQVITDPRVRDIIYIGDGTPTVGPIRTASVTSAVSDALGQSTTRVTAVAVGSSADLDTLGALARAGGGSVLADAPGLSLGQRTRAVLAATYGSALRDVEVVLPPGLSSIAPERLDTILAGSEANVSARMDSDMVDGSVVLRGKVDGVSFEERYDVHLVASENAGNAFVPRLYAAARIADLERNPRPDAKREALALSTRFAVASRYSSLLVLESEAMFRAFALHSTAPSAAYSGEDVAEANEAQGELSSEVSEEGGPGSALDAASSGTESKALAAPSPAPRAPRKFESDQEFAQPPPAASPVLRERTRALEEFPEPRRRLIPMRRVWERKGAILSAEHIPHSVNTMAIADAERAFAADPERRSALKKLYALYTSSGDASRATRLVERWTSKEPLSPEALTARADLAAARGERELAIRMLGSVVDVRPDDIAAQKRLARLYRWSGRPELGCRHAIAIAELRFADPKLLAAALRCARSLGGSREASRWASDALAQVDEPTAHLAESLSEGPAADETRLLGDLRAEASWSGGADLNIAILHPDGHRVSWLGAPTRELIAAQDVLSPEHEGLSLSGAKPGAYAIEVVQNGESNGPVHGELTLTVAGDTRRIPFTLHGGRMTVAWAEIRVVEKLIPVPNPTLIVDDGMR